MARIPESSSWEEEIELISRSERVSGGLDGVANRPLKSLANRTRYLKKKADESDELAAEKVSAVKTFAEGATLDSPRDEILHGAFRLVWTGEFPKIVPADSSPKTTGGVGVGAWAYTSDAVIRQELSLPDSAKLVGGIGFVSPEMFGYLHGVSPDAVPYYQKAVDEGHARGLPVQLTGKYYATTYPHKVTLPGDDGTAYPGWVAAGNDANIAAEPENHIYAAIRLYPDSVIIGDSMQNCALIGDWDSDTPVINNNQHIGYFISGDSSDGYIRPQLVNHGVRNFF
ncbi:tail fiber/spike domain-containing protein, partial [Klebsiella michiganensis]